MNSTWSQAAIRFRQAKEVAARNQAGLQQMRIAALEADSQNRQERDDIMRRCAAQLEAFLGTSDGRDAMELLRASGHHIVFGEYSAGGGGYGQVYFLDGNGLQMSIEAMGIWTAYARPGQVKKPELTPSTALEAVRAAVYYSHKDPDELLTWLKSELNAIALGAPSSR